MNLYYLSSSACSNYTDNGVYIPVIQVNQQINRVNLPSRADIIQSRAMEIFEVRKQQESYYLEYFTLLTRSNPATVLPYVDNAIEKIKHGKTGQLHQTKAAKVKEFFLIDNAERLDSVMDCYSLSSGKRRPGFDQLIMEIDDTLDMEKAIDYAMFYWDLKQAGNLITKKECIALATEEIISDEKQQESYYKSLIQEQGAKNIPEQSRNERKPVYNGRKPVSATISPVEVIEPIKRSVEVTPCKVQSMMKAMGCLIFDTIDDMEEYLEEIGEHLPSVGLVEGMDYITI